MSKPAVDEHELVAQRHSWLLERVADARRVTTTDAAAHLGVSVDTVRRDLRLLHDQGLLRRVHGGAVPVARLSSSFTGRSNESSVNSYSLAVEIVERFLPGQLIGLDGGSTCVDIASLIPSSLAITIITNNPAAAVALADHPNAHAILLGGHIDLNWMVTTGAETVDGWRNYQLDIGVVGLCGLDAEAGTTNSANEVATKRALIAASTDVIVPVHEDKIGVRAPYLVADVETFDTVVSNTPLPAHIKRACAKQGTQSVVARSRERSAG